MDLNLLENQVCILRCPHLLNCTGGIIPNQCPICPRRKRVCKCWTRKSQRQRAEQSRGIVTVYLAGTIGKCVGATPGFAADQALTRNVGIGNSGFNIAFYTTGWRRSRAGGGSGGCSGLDTIRIVHLINRI